MIETVGNGFNRDGSSVFTQLKQGVNEMGILVRRLGMVRWIRREYCATLGDRRWISLTPRFSEVAVLETVGNGSIAMPVQFHPAKAGC